MMVCDKQQAAVGFGKRRNITFLMQNQTTRNSLLNFPHFAKLKGKVQLRKCPIPLEKWCHCGSTRSYSTSAVCANQHCCDTGKSCESFVRIPIPSQLGGQVGPKWEEVLAIRDDPRHLSSERNEYSRPNTIASLILPRQNCRIPRIHKENLSYLPRNYAIVKSNTPIKLISSSLATFSADNSPFLL